MLRILAYFVLTIPLIALGYSSVIADPNTADVVLFVAEPASSQEFFGKLNNFPHTFEFVVEKEMPFVASLSVHDVKDQKNDVSLILVKKELRGVSEVARTSSTDTSWERGKDAMLAEAFRKGSSIETQLQNGEYVLEVSSPDNDGAYRLALNGSVERNYFDNVRVLLEVKSVYGSSMLSIFLSPLIYVPVMVLFLLFALGFWYRRQKHV